ncbi:DnaT-like ssDNA-binding domain-containing protein [Marinobacterium arenosum]|uniref:DnaT-like ssDNA-binding domain-containing protein n=1 Tax=Marinobacterium arenosum TaxID=2862496 RepID=UPI001C94CF2E|nr:DnaT-like ssDNA-binding domain-containing protein [Marinobacterium arenosum]MBY4676661.1 hypothetical protein [Marinobacterium arenosum]
MAISSPEQPLLVYPSQIAEFGLEGALLLQRYHSLLAMLGQPDEDGGLQVSLGRQQWLGLMPFWDEEQLATVTAELVALDQVEVGFQEDGQVVLKSLPTPAAELPVAEEPWPDAVQEMPPVSRQPIAQENWQEPLRQLPVRDTPPPVRRVQRRHINHANLMQQRGPAPTFGGSIGWQRGGTINSVDELHQNFQMHEERNQLLQEMHMEWRPSNTFFELLPRHSIPNEYAEELLDEFRLYWSNKDRKESNWDQKFLAWVKREWIRKQTREARQRNQDNEAGASNENPRRDSRENRKRVTAAIMDIRDTDW